KVATVGILAALGMTLTSLSVWSLTPAHEPVAQITGGDLVLFDPEPSGPGPAAPVVRADFTAGGTIMVEGRLGNAVMQAGRDNQTYVFARVFADDSARATQPAPLNLAIVIDRSGSMRGKRLDNALA